MSFSKKYEGHKWIKVKRYKDDPSQSWEERYKALERHHKEETEFLISEVRALADAASALEEKSRQLQRQVPEWPPEEWAPFQ